MLKKVEYCPKCKEFLSDYGFLAFDFYDTISNAYANDLEPISVEYIYEKYPVVDQILHFLEMKRLIVTTECDLEIIKIKPLGVSCYQIGDSYECFVCFKDGCAPFKEQF